MEDLTILITTYNRRERLSRMLQSIQQQKHFGEYKLVICDNHSDYDVKEYVLKTFDKAFTDHISIYCCPIKIGID